MQLEASHRVLDLYLWLGHRFASAFTGMEEVAQRRRALAALIDSSIRGMGVQRGARAEPDLAAPTEEQVAALAAALEQQQEQDWQRRKRSYRKTRR